MAPLDPKHGQGAPRDGDKPPQVSAPEQSPEGPGALDLPQRPKEYDSRDELGVLDDVRVGELIVSLQEAGISPSAKTGLRWCDFDRERALRELGPRSYAAAVAEIAAAHERGAIPDQPLDLSTPYALDLEWCALALTGLSHYRRNRPYQDACVVDVEPASGSLCGVVADGVSQVPLSQHAATILGGALARIARDLIADPSGRFRVEGSIMNPVFLGELHVRTAKAYLDLCELTGFHPEDAEEHFLATTLQLLVVTPRESAIFALSDGIYGWLEQYAQVSKTTERFAVQVNIPPLFERTLIEEGKRQRYGSMCDILSRCDEVEAALIKEAEAFKVVAYGSTAEVLPRIAEMASDGANVTDMQPLFGEASFPLVKLVVQDGRSMGDVETALKLFHIVHVADSIRSTAAVRRSWLEAQERYRGERWDTATRLERWIEELDAVRRPESLLALRDLVASLPEGYERSRGLSRNATDEGVRIVLGALRDPLKRADFAHRLEIVETQHGETIMRIAADIVASVDRSPVARDVATAIGGSLTEGATPDEGARAEIQAHRAALEGGTLADSLELLRCQPERLRLLRNRVVSHVAELAPRVLRDQFSIAQPLKLQPILDDLTWLAVGPRSDPEKPGTE
jgi:hypothetical protein